jgi:allantoinase
VHVLNGKIERVGPIEVQSGVPTIDCGDSVLMAGIVDTHVHINQPGRTEWEGFPTATRAAAVGGVTTSVTRAAKPARASACSRSAPTPAK